MPTLDWIGKKKVINHHLDVPIRVLEKIYTYSKDNKSQDSENKIIHGDNLEALKSLLPEYEGMIKCVYIDPPYNTGNDEGKKGWIYNDNVNDPRIRKWFGEIVGKESEDFTRHDKWLCMMYPRLKLLHKLLSDEGAIFISIDDNEQTYLKLLCDEIFGARNFVGTFIINTTPNARDYGSIGKMHEFCLFYTKDYNKFETNLIPEETKVFKYKDENGGFNVHPLYNSNVAFTNENRPNLYYPFYLHTDKKIDDSFYEIGLEKSSEFDIEIFPPKSVKDNVQFVWRWGKEKASRGLNTEIIGFLNENGEYRIVQKMRHDSKVIRSLLLDKEFTTRRGTSEVEAIFGKKVFPFPKPEKLIELLLYSSTDKDSIILDSFAGSGTTAHAVLEMNKKDGGNRKFILIEMMDYADSITAERVKRVIKGYADKEGTGGDFSFYELGEPLLINNLLNENVDTQKIREYIWFTETNSKMMVTSYSSGATVSTTISENKYFLGNNFGAAYWFFYEKNKVTTLDMDFLSTIKGKYDQYIIYADICLLPIEFMQKNNIIFKKIPRDIKKF